MTTPPSERGLLTFGRGHPVLSYHLLTPFIRPIGIGEQGKNAHRFDGGLGRLRPSEHKTGEDWQTVRRPPLLRATHRDRIIEILIGTRIPPTIPCLRTTAWPLNQSFSGFLRTLYFPRLGPELLIQLRTKLPE